MKVPVHPRAPAAITRRALLLALGAAAVTTSRPTRAQSWPERPIKWVVPFGAGSGADIVARVYAASLATALGQPVVIDNRVGASGAIAAEYAARAAPDGYTLFLGSQSTHASNPGMFRKLPYDPVKSFDPVSLLGSFPLLLVVNPALPVQTVQDLSTYAKANPGKLKFAYGTGSAQVTGELFRKLSGTEVLLVPYKSNPAAFMAVVGGESDCMVIDPGPSLPQIAAGRVRALAVTSAKRSALAPQLPTMVEAGMPGYELFGWNALLVPAGTPAALVTRLQAEIAAIAGHAEVKQRLAQAGIEAQSSTAPELRRFMESELAKWVGHIRNAGITPE